MSTNRASAAMMLRIAKVALQEFRRNDLYVAQAPAGMGLSDAHLDLLQQLEEDRLNDPGSVARLVEISRIVDCIQVQSRIATTPFDDPRYLSEVFPQIIKDVKFSTAPMNDSERRQYEAALAILYQEPPFVKTPAYQEFCMLRSDVEKMDVALVEMQRKLDSLQAEEDRKALEYEIEAKLKLCTEKREALDAIDRAYSFSAAENVVDTAERGIDQVPTSVLDVLAMMELFQITDPISNVTHVKCSFFPSHLAEDNWTPLKLTHEDIVSGSDEGEEAASDPNEIDESEIDSIELEVQSLVCERPWLWPALFENQHWNWDTPSMPISTGSQEEPEQDLIPAYIYGLIFIRNLCINLRTSAWARIDLLREVREWSKLSPLMRAIEPIDVIFEAGAATIVGRVATGDVAPLVSRSMVTPMLIRSHLVGPAVSRRSYESLPTDATLVDRTLIVKPWIIDKPVAIGYVVDEQGNGIYQATVKVEVNATLEIDNRRREWFGKFVEHGGFELLPAPDLNMVVPLPFDPDRYPLNVDLHSFRTTTTGTDGSFTFPTIDPGRYRVHVEKVGFKTIDGFIEVPYLIAPPTITMRQDESRQVVVRLQLDGGSPFVGDALVVIDTALGRRLESMDGRSEAIFPLPPGKFTISVSSSEAERVSPASLTLETGNGTSAVAMFTIYRRPVVCNPKVQVLSFVCRRVPLCPNPEG